MKKCIIKTVAVILTLLLTLSSGAVAYGTGSGSETQEPSEICSETEGTSRKLYLKVPYYNDGRSLSTKSITSENFNATVGDIFSLTYDEVDSSVNVTWTTSNPQGLSFVVNENDSRQCEITILSYQHGEVSITASANGNSKNYVFNEVRFDKEKYSAEVGDIFDLYLSDAMGGSLNGFGGNIEWSTDNKNGLSFEVDKNDKTHCTVMILSFNYGEVSIKAKINNDEYKYEFVYFDDVWESMFYSESIEYSKRMALLSTELCDAANSPDSDNIYSKYSSYGFEKISTENYGSFLGVATGSSAYAIALKQFDNENVVISITARGTTSLAEAIGDGAKGGEVNLTNVNEKIYNNVLEFEEIVWNGLENYVSDSDISEIINSAPKIVLYLTGHSLGGACVNALTARIDSIITRGPASWISGIDYSSVFCYTLGAIKVLPEEGDNVTPNIEDGFENIHNIYNWFDTYGPAGKNADQEVSSVYAKFGHTDIFARRYDEGTGAFDCENHWVSNYRNAIDNDLVNCACCEYTEDSYCVQAFKQDGIVGITSVSFNKYLFDSDSKYYSPNLCKFSAKLSMIGYDIESAKNCLEKIGFNPENIISHKDIDENHVNYFIASRDAVIKGKDYNIIIIGLIGTDGNQWYSDFAPKRGGIHNGFNTSKNYIKSILNNYFNARNYSKETTKILLTGHSRGAATANLLAADLIKSQELASMDNIYTYTFATPRCVKENFDDLYDADYKKTNGEDAVRFTRIFNIVNPEDFVTKCMPAKWKYGRYGRTFSLPSKTNRCAVNYNYELDRVRDHFSSYYGGETYYPFKNGEADTYNIVNIITNKIGNVDEYYDKQFAYNIKSDGKWTNMNISLYSFFRLALCRSLVENETSFMIGAYLNFVPPWPNDASGTQVDTFFQEVAKYFVNCQGLGNFTGWENQFFSNAHLMQTYCAFLDVVADDTTFALKEFGSYQGVANCPVDVEIYEKATGELVGRIKDNVVDEEIAAKPNSVVMTVDGDSKSFWLPSDGDYDVKLIGNDNGTMDYTLAEIDSDAGEVKRVNYFDVPITKNEAWSGTTSSEGFDIEEHTLTSDNGTVLTYTEDINEEDKKFSIDINIEGNGTADTSRTAVSGDYVAVTATPDEGNTFDGWYENGELLTSDAEYAFVAKSNRTLKAKFSENAAEQKYTATFIADGKVIKIVEFTDGTAKIDEPEVPYKEGYTGKWSGYVLSASNITINAVYEKISDNNPTANVVINVAGEKTIKYRTKVTIKATATNLDSKYHLVLCINGKEIKGNNKEVSDEYGELKNDVNYTVKIVDESNITQKDKEGKELKKSGGKITCNAGFFVRLIAFFQGLFNALPSETVEPK